MTRRKLTLILTGVLLAVILIFVAVFAIIANSKNDNAQPTEALSNWQKMIKDDALIKNVVTPGAHDAGTCGLPYFVETQDRDTSALLACGTRYFDLRVSYDNGKYRIYHGPSKGVTLDSVLDSVAEFMQNHPSEFVILDFQHFDEKNGEAQSGSITKTEAKLAGKLVVNDTAKTDLEFIETLTLGQVRGKCLVVWGRETDEILAKNTVFKRNNDDGTRENSVIHSYYDSSYNQLNSVSYIRLGLPKYIEQYKEANGGLFVLQGQLTDGMLIFGPHYREATHTDRMNEYVDNLATSSDLPIINIIMRDYVSPNKNCLALKLNVVKGLVIESEKEAYNAMLTANLTK